MEKNIYQTLAEVKKLYPEDIEHIESESEEIRKIVMMKNLAENEGAKVLVDMCKAHIVTARLKLSTDKALIGNETAQRELWALIEARMWILSFLTKNYDQELDSIHEQLKADLLQ